MPRWAAPVLIALPLLAGAVVVWAVFDPLGPGPAGFDTAAFADPFRGADSASPAPLPPPSSYPPLALPPPATTTADRSVNAAPPAPPAPPIPTVPTVPSVPTATTTAAVRALVMLAPAAPPSPPAPTVTPVATGAATVPAVTAPTTTGPLVALPPAATEPATTTTTTTTTTTAPTTTQPAPCQPGATVGAPPVMICVDDENGRTVWVVVGLGPPTLTTETTMEDGR